MVEAYKTVPIVQRNEPRGEWGPNNDSELSPRWGTTSVGSTDGGVDADAIAMWPTTAYASAWPYLALPKMVGFASASEPLWSVVDQQGVNPVEWDRRFLWVLAGCQEEASAAQKKTI